MPQTSDAHDVFAHSEMVVARAKAACARSLQLQSDTCVGLQSAKATRVAAVEARMRILLGRVALFVVKGLVDGEHAEARWVAGRGLLCQPELLARASVIVALGETFSAPDVGRTVAASLDDPLASMLTVMRAFSSIESVQMGRDMATARAGRHSYDKEVEP